MVSVPTLDQEEVAPMAFTLSPHLDHIDDWVPGTRSYCRKCDGLVAFDSVDSGNVACAAGHRAHPANLIINGTRPPLRAVAVPTIYAMKRDFDDQVAA